MAIKVTVTQLTPRPRATLDRLTLIAAALALSLMSSACGNRQPEITPTTLGADRLLFERGMEALDNENWVLAREYFVQLRDNYPQSNFRSQARLAVADTFDGQGTTEAYILALEEYRDFLALSPTDDRADYAQYKLAMVHFKQMRRPERDQSETRNAISEFRLFEERYQDSEMLGEVRARRREAEDRLSEASYVVGHFYYRNEWYPGAIDRFEAILRDDPGYTGMDSVYFHLAHSYQESSQPAKALPLFERLLSEFPETEYLEQASIYMEALEDVETELAVPPQTNTDPQTTSKER